MSNDDDKKDTPNTAEVSVNWEGLKRFMGWQGSVSELKKLDLDDPRASSSPSRGSK